MGYPLIISKLHIVGSIEIRTHKGTLIYVCTSLYMKGRQNILPSLNTYNVWKFAKCYLQ